jgi:hypothetical protein
VLGDAQSNADHAPLGAPVEAHLENGRQPRIEALDDLRQSHHVESREHLIVGRRSAVGVQGQHRTRRLDGHGASLPSSKPVDWPTSIVAWRAGLVIDAAGDPRSGPKICPSKGTGQRGVP